MKTLQTVSVLMLGTVLSAFSLAAFINASPQSFDSRAVLLIAMLFGGVALIGLPSRHIHRLYKSVQTA